MKAKYRFHVASILFVYVVINIALMDLFILCWPVTTHNFCTLHQIFSFQKFV